MSMFDTHCHLFLPSFENNLDKTIKQARENGVKYFVVPAIDKKTSKDAVFIANHYQGVYAACGVHPTQDLENMDIDNISAFLQEILTNEKKVVAIGEVGLDYYKYQSPKRVQKAFFKMQIKIATRNDLPVIIHNRHATRDLISLLENQWSPSLSGKIIFHCSQPDEEILDFALKRNSFIGVDGDITYDSQKANFIKRVPLSMLFLETDSPYLTPLPVRGEKKFPNSPKNIKHVAKKVADVKSLPLEKVVKQTTQNAKGVFSIKD